MFSILNMLNNTTPKRKRKKVKEKEKEKRKRNQQRNRTGAAFLPCGTQTFKSKLVGSFFLF